MLRKPNMFDIWTAELPMKKGSHIQGGFRPVLVVSNNRCNRHSPIISVIPITSKQKKQKLPTHVVLGGGGLEHPSTALCEQILLIDKTALRKKTGLPRYGSRAGCHPKGNGDPAWASNQL